MGWFMTGFRLSAFNRHVNAGLHLPIALVLLLSLRWKCRKFHVHRESVTLLQNGSLFFSRGVF